MILSFENNDPLTPQFSYSLQTFEQGAVSNGGPFAYRKRDDRMDYELSETYKQISEVVVDAVSSLHRM